jgi:hypothetical protein
MSIENTLREVVYFLDLIQDLEEYKICDGGVILSTDVRSKGRELVREIERIIAANYDFDSIENKDGGDHVPDVPAAKLWYEPIREE